MNRKSEETLKTARERAGQTKIHRTQERIEEALSDLLREMPAIDITLTALCRRAGLSTDPLYASHHNEFRLKIEKRLSDQVKAQSQILPVRRKRISVSLTAELRISQLEEELAEQKEKYKTALQALNVLSQVVDALSEGSKRTPSTVSLLFTDRTPKLP